MSKQEYQRKAWLGGELANRRIASSYYIVPTRHSHAHVNGDRNGWCIREDEFRLFKFALPPPCLCQERPAGVRCWTLVSSHCTYQPAPLSPNPCATITVDVCRLIAGTMRAFGPDILRRNNCKSTRFGCSVTSDFHVVCVGRGGAVLRKRSVWNLPAVAVLFTSMTKHIGQWSTPLEWSIYNHL